MDVVTRTSVTFETLCACSEADSFTRLMEVQVVVT